MIDENIEKSLKRFLKRKISVNESVVVKFLITGLIGATLTACGGGGGGGGSSSGGVTPLPKPVEKPVEDIFGKNEVVGQNVVIKGDKIESNISNKPAIVIKDSTVTNEAKLNLSGDKVTAISAISSTINNKADITLEGQNATAISTVNSTVNNNADITLNGDDTVGLKGEVDTVLRNKDFEISIQNNKTIDLKGKRNIGLLILSKSGLISGMNNGTINANNTLEINNTNKSFWKDYSFGMIGVGNGSKITNSSKGTINVSGSSVGMFTKNGKAINDGTINIESNIPNDGKKYKAPVGMVADGKGTATNNGSIKVAQTFIPESDDLDPRTQMSKGMYILNGSTGINNKNIEVQGSSVGMFADGENSKAINKGTITLSGKDPENDNYVPTIGMGALDGGILTNDGKIVSDINSSTAMYAENGTIVNNGSIEMNGDDNDGIIGDFSNITNNGSITGTGNDITGMETSGKGFKTVNNKEITLTGEYNYGMGAIEGATAINEKNAIISINGNNSIGMGAEDFGSEVINKGNIEINGNETAGMLAENGGKATNDFGGEISIKGNNNVGILSYNSNTQAINNGDIKLEGKEVGAIAGLGKLENNGNIKVISTKTESEPYNWTSYGMYISKPENDSDERTVGINNGTIDISGSSIIGMYAWNGKIINNKEIIIDGTGGENGQVTGMYFNEGSIGENNGIIITKGDKNTGIVSDENSQAINKGEIRLEGSNSTGMVINNQSIGKNESIIEIESLESVGMSANNNSTATNEKTGTIKVDSDDSFGMYAYNIGSEAINKGKIEANTALGGGMSAVNGASLLNDIGATIDISGERSFGMKAHDSGSTAINRGTIEVNTIDGGGVLATNGASIINEVEGIINVSGEKNFGMIARDSESKITNKGTINVKNNSFNGGGMLARDGAIAVNEKEIKIDATNRGGMIAEVSGKAINDTNGKIIINGNNSSGMIARSDSQATNKGSITINNNFKIDTTSENEVFDENFLLEYLKDFSFGMKGIGNNSSITNSGDINIKGSSVGMITQGGEAINNGTINIESNVSNDGKEYKAPIGMVATGNGIATNNGTISGSGNGDIQGMFAYNGGTVINGESGKINLKGESVTALNGLNGTVINKGEITANGHVMELSGGQGINEGTIIITTNDDSAILSEDNANVTNEETGIIKISGDLVAGITADIELEDVENGDIISGVQLVNKGTIEITSENLGMNPDQSVKQHSTGIYLGTNDGTATVKNSGNIIINGNNSDGIYAYNGTIKNEKGGNISITGDMGTGLYISGQTSGSAINNGEITITGNNGEGIFAGEKTTAVNNGIITVSGNNGSGMNSTLGAIIVNDSKGEINIKGENSFGMSSHVENSVVKTEEELLKTATTNNGTININGVNSVGIHVDTTNRGHKDVWGALGINQEGATINVGGNENTGMYGYNSDIINYGTIEVNGINSVGMKTSGLSFADNKGVITVTGENSVGMLAENGGKVTNEIGGVINVKGKGSYGMRANNGGTAINEEGATINVGANASGGILADGGIVKNYGIINIHKDNKITETNDVIISYPDAPVEHSSVLKSAINVINNGTAYNYGEIKTGGEFTINTDKTSAYVIGTTKSGSYGKISAKSINLDGNVIVDSTIASVDFKDSYTLDNAISSEETKLGKDFKVLSNTLLYDATAKKDDSKNNLDVELSRNENNLVDFTSKEYDNLASVFDKGINDKEFRDTLSDEAKEVLNNVFANTTSGQNIQNRLKEISGVEYTNIARQIFDTKDIFKSYDSSIINTLDDYQFNFNFIGNYSDVEAKGNLLGYESQMTGISGAMKFNDSLYGVIGYGYNDIDFDGKSEGNIKSVHTGIYKDMKLNSFDVRLGVFGEYNFHEVERDLTNKIAKGDFNSYLLGACGEISQRFGDSLYVKPALSLDVTYGRYEDFTEDGAEEFNLTVDSQDYTSIVPAIEVKVGKDFEMASIYSTVKFGYEFGDMNKLQYAKLGNLETPLPFTDEIENAQTDVKVGTAFEINNFTFNAEVGKEFGKRDREYVTAGFTYTF